MTVQTNPDHVIYPRGVTKFEKDTIRGYNRSLKKRGMRDLSWRETKKEKEERLKGVKNGL